MLGAWLIGGMIALIGAFVYAELAVLRRAWVANMPTCAMPITRSSLSCMAGLSLLVVQTGGMAGAAIIFGRYFRELSGLSISEQVVASPGTRRF